MATAQIYIQETTPIEVAFNRSFLKDVASVAELFVYIPAWSYSNASLRELDTVFEFKQIPLSVYDETLANVPLGKSGEFNVTETILLPSAASVYSEIVAIPQLAGLVNPTDTLPQLITAIGASGYLVTFNNLDIIYNSMSCCTESFINIIADYTADATATVIIADSTTNDITVTLPNNAAVGLVYKVKVDDKTSNSIFVVGQAPALIDGISASIEIAKTAANQLNNSISFYFDGTDYKAI